MNVVVGQRVSVYRAGKFRTGYVVTKISPSGQITVERGSEKYRFTPEGYQIGGSGFYERARLVTTK